MNSPVLCHELTILLYHHMGKSPQSATIHGLYTTERQFDWQMRQLRRLGVRFLTCADLVKQTYPDSDPVHWVMVTFDDGSRSVFEQAFPILKKHKIPAVIYPIAGDVGKSRVVWEHSTDKSEHAMLTVQHIREMARFGIEFGSHFVHHVHATQLPEHELNYELGESKKILEAILDKEILSVAYPFGSYSTDVMQAAQKAGYRFGLSTRSGTNINRNPLELCRVPVKGTRWHHYWYFRQFLEALKRSMAV
jgi:peptidoglycan/xylan/chitin deacetylase (PgdA/CDA1 family)